MDDRDDMQAWAYQQELEHRYFCEVVMKHEQWNRCDACGKFIALDDFDKGAVRKLVTPDSFETAEEWETLCIKCADTADTFSGEVKYS
jgi:hypothetical protein